MAYVMRKTAVTVTRGYDPEDDTLYVIYDVTAADGVNEVLVRTTKPWVLVEDDPALALADVVSDVLDGLNV